MDRVADWMTPHPVKVAADAAIAEVAATMMKLRFRHVPVVDGDKGALIGIATDFGVFNNGCLIPGEPPAWVYRTYTADLTARDVAVPVDVIATPETALVDVLPQLVDTPQDAVVVVEQGRPVGILTEHDGVRYARALLNGDVPVQWISTHNPLTIDRDGLVQAAFDQMKAAGVRHLIVTDNGRAHAVLSMRDLLDAGIPSTASVGELLGTGPMRFVGHTAMMMDAANLMTEHKVGCVPVLRDGEAIGVITRTDIILAGLRVLRAEV
jgi:CBS domain-containing protein